MEKFAKWDMAEALETKDDVIACLDVALADMDMEFLFETLGALARAKGMTQIARQTGLSREQLYRSFGADGNPTLRTTLAVMKALGIELSAKPTAVL